MKIAKKDFFISLWKIFIPFWKSKESKQCKFLLLGIFLLSGLSVFFAKQFNSWYNDFYNALQEYDLDVFCSQMFIFCVLAAINVFVVVTNYYIKQKVMIEWRHWMSTSYMKKWLKDGVFYRMGFISNNVTDNPDQRIAEDLHEFVNLTFSLTIGILTDLAMLVTFFTVLWSLSSATSFTLGDTTISLPDGYLCYLAIIYAVVGTFLTFIIGKPLIRLNYNQQKVEANYRYSLVRVRENSESIALYKGSIEEGRYLEDRFSDVVRNFYRIMLKTVHVEFFSLSYKQASVVFPFIISSPLYFAKIITLGSLIQISSAFGRVQDSLSTLIENFTSIARWKSVVDRLIQFSENMEKTEDIENLKPSLDGSSFVVSNMNISTPNGQQLMVDGNFSLNAGDALLIRGPSGCGKTTLFKTIAGLWPYAKGDVIYPNGESFFLSQKPYIPLGTLRAAISYPHAPYQDHVIVPLLALAGLEKFCTQLDTESNWGQILSLGEQQKVAFVRALLIRPAIIFLDEASSAMDEDLECLLYSKLKEILKDSIIISVGHRSTLKQFHNLHLEWSNDLHWQIENNVDYIEDGQIVENSDVQDEGTYERYLTAYSRPNNKKEKGFILKILNIFSFKKRRD